jgi:hypothetical protein
MTLLCGKPHVCIWKLKNFRIKICKRMLCIFHIFLHHIIILKFTVKKDDVFPCQTCRLRQCRVQNFIYFPVLFSELFTIITIKTKLHTMRHTEFVHRLKLCNISNHLELLMPLYMISYTRAEYNVMYEMKGQQRSFPKLNSQFVQRKCNRVIKTSI